VKCQTSKKKYEILKLFFHISRLPFHLRLYRNMIFMIF